MKTKTLYLLVFIGVILGIFGGTKIPHKVVYVYRPSLGTVKDEIENILGSRCFAWSGELVDSQYGNDELPHCETDQGIFYWDYDRGGFYRKGYESISQEGTINLTPVIYPNSK